MQNYPVGKELHEISNNVVCGTICDQQRLRPACAYAQSDQSRCLSLEYSMTLRLLTEHQLELGAQWLSGRVFDLRPRGRGFEPHRRHCVVVLEQDTFILAYYWFNPGRPVPV